MTERESASYWCRHEHSDCERSLLGAAAPWVAEDTSELRLCLAVSAQTLMI